MGAKYRKLNFPVASLVFVWKGISFVANNQRELLVTIGKASNIFQMITYKECSEKMAIFSKNCLTLIGCCIAKPLFTDGTKGY